MSLITLPQFDEITTALEETELKLHASQIHGLITGVLCGNFNEETDWQELVMGEKLAGETAEKLQLLYEGTAKQLQDFLFEFNLLMPSDELDLSIRAEALTVWCQGYLTGLKVAGVPITDREPGELTEAIDDLIEIAKMNYSQVVESEEDEVAYAELAEYVRVVVIFIFQEVRAEVSGRSAENTNLH